MITKAWTVAGGAVLLASASVAQMTPHTPPVIVAPAPSAAYLPATTALYQNYVRTGRTPGIVGAFGVSDNPTLFVAAGRIATDPAAAPAGPDSLWRVYSMTKPITALAAMILIEQGRIGLDDPLAKYFPAFARMRVLTDPDHSLETRPAIRPITIRELLTHTAGLGYSIITKGPLLHEYERLGIVPFASDARTEAQVRPTRPRNLAEFADRVATLPLIAEPGTKWSYSIGLDVMGAVIERASGMPFDAFVNTRIFAPLGMRSSFWRVPAVESGRLATNYAYLTDMPVPLDPGRTSVFLQQPSFPYGGAGLVMSARDYDTFLHLLQDRGTLNGVTIVRPETADLMMSNLLPPGVTYGGVNGATGGSSAATPTGYGAGGTVTLADGPGGFPSKGTYGWGGAAGTIAWVDRARRFRATVMVNYFPANRLPLREDTGRALVADARRLAGQ